jgi:hypothetical protein
MGFLSFGVLTIQALK